MRFGRQHTRGCFALLLLVLQLSTYAQFRLDPGESVTFHFENLPFSENHPVAGASTGSAIAWYVNWDSLHARDDFRYELFENSPSESPFLSATYLPGASPSTWHPTAGSYWQDLQGSVRFTGISGTVVIDRVVLTVYTPRDELSVDNYSITIVPEPGPLSLIAVGVFVFAIFWHRTRAVDNPSAQQ